MPKFLFDVKMFAQVEVEAETRAAASAKVKHEINNFAAVENCELWTFYLTVDGEPDLTSVDGVDV